jgi:hypothetical protein
MRKAMIIVLLVFMMTLSLKMTRASEYLTYQEITFLYDGPKLLEDYSKDEYETYYGKISGRRFWGWKTYKVQESEPVEFVKETLFVIVNDGDTAISQTFDFGQKETIKKQYAVSGTIGIKGKGSEKKFELGLEEKLSFDASAVSTTVVDESVKIDIKIDPGTQMIVQVCGEGKVSNGVAKYFRFFREVKKGGWELFVVTTEFFSLVKEQL